MSGALPLADVGIARRRPTTGRKRAALSKIGSDADHAKAIDALKARRDAALAKERGGEVQISSSLPEKPIKPTEGQYAAAPTSTIKSHLKILSRPISRIGATPSRDASVLGSAPFQTRPRKASLLQPAQSQISPSSNPAGGSDDDLDNFYPEDESTPFAKHGLHKSIQRTPSNSSPATSQLRSSRKRKLTPPEIQVPMSQPVDPQVPASEAATSSSAIHSDIGIRSTPDNNETPRLPTPKRRSRRQTTPHIYNDPQPPQSRSPASASSIALPTLPKARANTRQTRPRLSPKRYSPGPSPRSPSPSQAPVTPASRALKPLATATLQNLLPKRRARSKKYSGLYEMPSSDAEVDEDEDELSRQASAKARRNTKEPKRRTTALGSGASDKSRRTYGRKPVAESSEGEASASESDPNENTRLGKRVESKKKYGLKDTRVKQEMQRLARKFAEVDEYEMEFEDVTASSSSQMMKDAR